MSCKGEYGFLKVKGVKFPDLLNFQLDKNLSFKKCELSCLKNCSCSAYASSDVRQGKNGCLMWFDNLFDVRKFSSVKDSAEQYLYIKLSSSELSKFNF